MSTFANQGVLMDAALLIILLVAYLGHKKLHALILRLEAFVQAHLPAPQAAAVDTVLTAVDTMTTQPPQQSVADMLAVLKQLTEAGVINSNVKVVAQAKAENLFNGALAASVKSDTAQSILQDLGPMKDALEAHVGAVEPIIGKFIEMYVQEQKK